MKIVLIAIALVVVGAAYLVFFSGPPVKLENRGPATRVDLHLLGEYCIGVSRIRIIDVATKQVVWEVVANDGWETRICDFELAAGTNPVRVGQREDAPFAVIEPGTETFPLVRGRKYDLEITGNNGFATWRTTRRRLQL